MRQRELEMRLQKLDGFSNPKASLEQYPTPAKIAADVLYTAHAHGDICGKRVADLGCGTGIFSLGACLLGAAEVMGLDIDRDALEIAEGNALREGCRVEFRLCPVEAASGRYETCVMNPPFGSQSRHADIPFLEKAMEMADVVYSIHNSETMAFLRGKAAGAGWLVGLEKNYKFEIRHTFEFHRKERAYFDVTMVRMFKP